MAEDMIDRAIEAYVANAMGALPDQVALRAALLAVLDPEDEALVESIARSISWCGRDWDTPFDFDSAPDYAKDMQRDIARAAILTIKHAAQGEHGG